MLHVATITGDDEVLRRAATRASTLQQREYLPEYDEFEHLYHYTLAFAQYVLGNTDHASTSLGSLTDVQHGTDQFEALQTSLTAIITEDRAGALAGLARLLKLHRDEHGQHSDIATEFVSVDATALLVLARRHGLDIAPDDFDEDLREFLPAALFETRR